MGLYYDTDISGCLGNIFKAILIYATNGNHTRVWSWNSQRRDNGQMHSNICENYSLINVKGFLKSHRRNYLTICIVTGFLNSLKELYIAIPPAGVI